MATLKDLRIRISSVKSTQKITSAMKMVAAAKLRKAQLSAEAGRPFSDRMERMVTTLARATSEQGGGPKLLTGNGDDDTHLFVIISSDRGLCGGFNGSIGREVRGRAYGLIEQGKKVKMLFVGRKAKDILTRDFKDSTVDTIEGLTRTGANFTDANELSTRLRAMFEAGEFDICHLVYTRFQSAMTQIVQVQPLIPFAAVDAGDEVVEDELDGDDFGGAIFEYEPSEEGILEELLPRNMAVQMFKGLLESYASEQGARMTAMDNATRNAGDMIDRLTLTYNRTRQANITSELIEIISGAEAL